MLSRPGACGSGAPCWPASAWPRCWLITLIHGNRGSAHGLQAYAYLAVPGAKATGHLPLTSLAAGDRRRTRPGCSACCPGNGWTCGPTWPRPGWSASPSSPLLPLILIVELANSLFHGVLFAEPLFQSLPVYVFLPVASVAVLAGLTARRRWLGRALTGPGGGPGPRLGRGVGRPAPPARGCGCPPGRGRPVPDRADDPALGRGGGVRRGSAGRFASRADVRILLGARLSAGVSRPDVWFIVLPSSGVETQGTGSAMALVGRAGRRDACPAGPCTPSGVWAFDWHPPGRGAPGCSVPGAGPDPGPGPRRAAPAAPCSAGPVSRGM